MKLVDKKEENTKAGRGETKGMVRTPKKLELTSPKERRQNGQWQYLKRE